jgi:hypothetical protein
VKPRIVVTVLSSLVIIALAGCAIPTAGASGTGSAGPSAETRAPTPTTTAEVTPAEVTWDVTMLPGWRLEEKICWKGTRISVVMPEARSGLRFAESAVDVDGRPLAVTERGAPLREPTTSGCATVTVDAAKAAMELDDNDALALSEGAMFGTPDVWLWRPEPWPTGVVGKLSLTLPEGISASMPWPKDDDGRFLIDATTWKMMCKCAFGRLSPRTLEVGDASFTLTKLPGALSATDEGLDRWLTRAAGAVSLVGGRFPVRHAQVLVLPVGAGAAIPFGMAMRGGGPTAMMLVSRTATDDQLLGEWVAVHELSHLLLPPINREDAWLSEGLASYYQETLRGRAGLRSVEASWDNLVDGFERGRNAAKDVPLAEASARMYSDFGFLHVYWGGAAILFRLDVELRKKGRSLDEVVAAVRVREPRDVAYRAADEVVGWMAEAAPDVDVHGIVARSLAEPFPRVDDLLAELGVSRVRGRIRLREDAPLADVRRAIASPASETAVTAR